MIPDERHEAMIVQIEQLEQLVRDMVAWMREGYELVFAENMDEWEKRHDELLARAKELLKDEDKT